MRCCSVPFHAREHSATDGRSHDRHRCWVIGLLFMVQRFATGGGQLRGGRSIVLIMAPHPVPMASAGVSIPCTSASDGGEHGGWACHPPVGLNLYVASASPNGHHRAYGCGVAMAADHAGLPGVGHVLAPLSLWLPNLLDEVTGTGPSAHPPFCHRTQRRQVCWL